MFYARLHEPEALSCERDGGHSPPARAREPPSSHVGWGQKKISFSLPKNNDIIITFIYIA
jgi:hypothetical protein